MLIDRILALFDLYKIDGYITPMYDEHLNEFINENDNKVFPLTGFTGTAGTAVTLKNFKGLITDGRYYEQAKKQSKEFKLVKQSEISLEELLIKKGAKRVGIDSRYISYAKYLYMVDKLSEAGIVVVDIDDLVLASNKNRQERVFNEVEDLEKVFVKVPSHLKELMINPKSINQIIDWKILDNSSYNSNEQAQNSNLSRIDQVPITPRVEIIRRNGLVHPMLNNFDIKTTIMNKKSNYLKDDSQVKDVDVDHNFVLQETIKLVQSLQSVKKPEDPHKRAVNALENKNITGSSRIDKINKIKNMLKNDQGLLVTELDTIAWIFNLRGSDIKYNPVFYSYAYISKHETILFTNANVSFTGITIKPYESFENFIDKLKEKQILISGKCNAFIAKKLNNKEFTNTVRTWQSVKNEVELFGLLKANIYDSVALVKLFEWLEENENVTEKEVEKKLHDLKTENPDFKTDSFRAIVGFGKNGAELHHNNSDTKLKSDNSEGGGETILIDSGSQYLYGTTDITRTIHFNPSAEQKTNYTLVLKGAIASRMQRGGSITGDMLDKLSRKFLNEKGSDYAAATGHGVGAGLFVHENPPSVSRESGELQKNQVFSIEPGYYKTGSYGIRIEDVVFLNEVNGEKKITDLTFVPLHLNLIDVKMLTEEEKEYINRYNYITRKLILPLVNEATGGKRYLMENTVKI